MYIHIRIYTCIHTYICVYTYVHIYIPGGCMRWPCSKDVVSSDVSIMYKYIYMYINFPIYTYIHMYIYS